MYHGSSFNPQDRVLQWRESTKKHKKKKRESLSCSLHHKRQKKGRWNEVHRQREYNRSTSIISTIKLSNFFRTFQRSQRDLLSQSFSSHPTISLSLRTLSQKKYFLWPMHPTKSETFCHLFPFQPVPAPYLLLCSKFKLLSKEVKVHFRNNAPFRLLWLSSI